MSNQASPSVISIDDKQEAARRLLAKHGEFDPRAAKEMAAFIELMIAIRTAKDKAEKGG